MRLVLATKNRNKFNEIRNLFKNPGQVFYLGDFSDIPDVDEKGRTFLENAELKARTIYERLKVPVLADDSGLEVRFLNNEPGVYSRRYAGAHGSDQDRIQKLLKKLEKVPWRMREARFVCAMVLIDKGRLFPVTGFCHGFISFRPRGDHGFGYDPVFFLPDLKKTMAELSLEEKNMISHRANAIKKMMDILEKNYEL